MELSHYAIDSNGVLVYHSFVSHNNYIVWGVGRYGLLHGVGAYLTRDNKSFIINPISLMDIEAYYKGFDKFL